MKKIILLASFMFAGFFTYADCIDVANSAVETRGCDVSELWCLNIWYEAYYDCLESDT